MTESQIEKCLLCSNPASYFQTLIAKPTEGSNELHPYYVFACPDCQSKMREAGVRLRRRLLIASTALVLACFIVYPVLLAVILSCIGVIVLCSILIIVTTPRILRNAEKCAQERAAKDNLTINPMSHEWLSMQIRDQPESVCTKCGETSVSHVVPVEGASFVERTSSLVDPKDVYLASRVNAPLCQPCADEFRSILQNGRLLSWVIVGIAWGIGFHMATSYMGVKIACSQDCLVYAIGTGIFVAGPARLLCKGMEVSFFHEPWLKQTHIFAVLKARGTATSAVQVKGGIRPISQ